jgi:hypothetical protein
LIKITFRPITKGIHAAKPVVRENGGGRSQTVSLAETSS